MLNIIYSETFLGFLLEILMVIPLSYISKMFVKKKKLTNHINNVFINFKLVKEEKIQQTAI